MSSDLQFNASQFFLEVQGLLEETFIVLRFCGNSLEEVEGQHGFSEDYCFQITVHSKENIQSHCLINKNCVLKIQCEQGVQKIYGVITQIESSKTTHEGLEYGIQVHSPLYRLKLRFPSRVYINKTIIEIIEDVLQQAGWLKGQEGDYEIKVSRAYLPIDSCVQLEQSDFELIVRLMNRWGLYFYFKGLDTSYKLMVVDNTQFLLTLREPIIFQPTTHHAESLLAIWPSWQILTDHYLYSEYDVNNPTRPFQILSCNTTDIKGEGEFHVHGENFRTEEEGRCLSTVRQEALDWQREVYYAKSTRRDLLPGYCMIVKDHPEPMLNGEFIIVNVTHKGDQAGALYGKQADTELRYYNELLLIKAKRPYRKPETRSRHYQASLVGVIEGMDESGNYYFRYPFDNKNQEKQASPATRQLQPLAGGGKNVGFHFPNQRGAEVEIFYINGDINRPIIAGALYNEKTGQNPVTSQNSTENRIVTPGGNELYFSDKMESEQIIVSTQNRNNSLTLDATHEKEKVELRTLGNINFKAGQNANWETEGDFLIYAGQDYKTEVENNYHLIVHDDIEWQSKKNIYLKTEQGIHINADKNIKFISKENISLQADQLDLEALKQNCTIESIKSSITVKVNQDIQWMASESLSFSQAGATVTLKGSVIEINTPGDIRIESQKNVEFIGQQNRGNA